MICLRISSSREEPKSVDLVFEVKIWIRPKHGFTDEFGIKADAVTKTSMPRRSLCNEIIYQPKIFRENERVNQVEVDDDLVAWLVFLCHLTFHFLLLDTSTSTNERTNMASFYYTPKTKKTFIYLCTYIQISRVRSRFIFYTSTPMIKTADEETHFFEERINLIHPSLTTK